MKKSKNKSKNKRRNQLFFVLFLVLCLIPAYQSKAANKPIYTGNTRIDCAAQKIIDRCTKPKMDKKQKLKAVYVYLVKNMHYSHSRGSVRIYVTRKERKAYRQETKQLKKAGKIKQNSRFASDYINLLTMQGTCKDMSGVFCILANHLGYHAGYDTGRYVRSNGSSVEHWWNYVTVNGSRRYCDVQAANASYKSHHSMAAVYSFYLRTKGSYGWRIHHRG